MFLGEVGGGGRRGGEKSCSLDLSSLSGLGLIHLSLLCSIYQPFFFTLVLICLHCDLFFYFLNISKIFVSSEVIQHQSQVGKARGRKVWKNQNSNTKRNLLQSQIGEFKDLQN